MKSKKLPSTSLDAYKQAHPEMINAHHQKIIDALQALGTGIYEEIADFATMEKNQVSRRLKEMEGKQIVYKPGTKKKTKSGREAYQYCLASAGQKTQIEKFNGKEKSTSDEAKEIIKSTTRNQPELF